MSMCPTSSGFVVAVVAVVVFLKLKSNKWNCSCINIITKVHKHFTVQYGNTRKRESHVQCQEHAIHWVLDDITFQEHMMSIAVEQ